MKTTTTTTEVPGCCAGDSAKSNPMCNARDSKTRCEKSSSCHFIENCNPDAAYSNKCMDTCTGYHTERECLCRFEELVEGTTARCCYRVSCKANGKCLMAAVQEQAESIPATGSSLTRPRTARRRPRRPRWRRRRAAARRTAHSAKNARAGMRDSRARLFGCDICCDGVRDVSYFMIGCHL